MTTSHALDIKFSKAKYRKQLSLQRKQLSPSQRAEYSQRIMLQLEQHLALHYANTPLQLLIYRALPVEVDTSALFRKQQHIFAPRMLPDNQLEWVEVTPDTTWTTSQFGVSEPKHGKLWQADQHKSVLICPLLGFDRLGNRLGMGKGYFDRWLEHHAKQLDAQIGLAFSCQMLPKVPMEQHDAPLATIITELEVISCPIA